MERPETFANAVIITTWCYYRIDLKGSAIEARFFQKESLTKSFPRRMEPRALFTGAIKNLQDWPMDVASSGIWDIERLQAEQDFKIPEKDMNARRQKSAIPGTPLPFTPQDSVFPLLLLQRNTAFQNSSQQESPELVSGWDLILPSAWAREVWKCLVFGGARVGGLREQRMLHYESGRPLFPYDYPETKAFESEVEAVAKDLEALHDRTPVSKRPNFEALGITSPFLSRFDGLVGQEIAMFSGREWTAHFSSFLQSNPRPEKTDRIFSAFLEANPVLKAYAQFSSVSLVDSSLMRVRLRMMHRGAPQDRSWVYAATAQEYASWIKVLKEEDHPMLVSFGSSLQDVFPDESRVIGYVTTGHFSWKRGHGSAIASCSLQGLVRVFEVSQRWGFVSFIS